MPSRSAAILMSAVLALPLLASAERQPEHELRWPKSSVEVVTYLMDQPYRFVCGDAARQHAESLKPLYDRISANPAEFKQLIAGAGQLPDTIDACIEPARQAIKQAEDLGAYRIPARPGTLARVGRVIELSALLGREAAEPILNDTFQRASALHKDLQPLIAKAREEWKKRGGWEHAAAPADRAELIFLSQVEGMLTGLATNTILAAQRLNSAVLVDPVLEFYESGRYDCQSGWPEYVVKCGGERPDVLPRLRKIADDPKVDHARKWQIERALARDAAKKA